MSDSNILEALINGSSDFPQQLVNIVGTLIADMGVPDTEMHKINGILQDMTSSANEVGQTISTPGSIKQLVYCTDGAGNKRPLPEVIDNYLQKIQTIFQDGEADLAKIFPILNDMENVCYRKMFQEDRNSSFYKLSLQFKYNDLLIAAVYLLNMNSSTDINISVSTPGMRCENLNLLSTDPDDASAIINLHNCETNDTNGDQEASQNRDTSQEDSQEDVS